MDTEEKTLWIWLSLSCTPASLTFGKLLAAFDTPRAIYEASEDEIAAVIGRRTRDLSALCQKDLSEASRILNFCEKHGVGLLPYGASEYPSALKEIYAPPVLLYYRGVLPDFEKRFFAAVVGSRRMSEYGKRSAFHISMDLARAGAVVVSGMALGIDGVALAGALSADAVTLAVIGSGIDVCYPPEHRTLAREIVKRGAVLTEYPPGSPPNHYHFPARNRIIAGLSAATLVIEGEEKSGSLITARHAKTEGKAVYALPGNVDCESSGVTNLLLKDGARVLTSADDVIRDFEYLYPGELDPFRLSEPISVRTEEVLRRFSVSSGKETRRSFLRRKEPLAEQKEVSRSTAAEGMRPVTVPEGPARVIWERIPQEGSCTVESIIGGDITLRDVTKYLLKLELLGLIEMLPGERVERKRS